MSIQIKRQLTPNEVSNPFIEITSSVLLLTRLSVALVIGAIWLVALTSVYTAPYMVTRLLVATIYILVSSLPLWFPIPGIGIVHPLFVIASLILVKSTFPSIGGYAIGMSAHGALPGFTSASIAMLQVQVILMTTLASAMTYVGYFTTRGIKWKFVTFRDRRKIATYAGVACFFIGSVSLYLLIQISGGLFLHLKNIARGHANKVWVGDAELASAYGTLVLMVVVAPALWMLKSKKATANPAFWALVAYTVTSAFLINGRRSAVLANVLVIAACFVLKTRKVAMGRLAVAAILVFLSVGVLGDYRRSNWRQGSVTFEAFTDIQVDEAMARSFQEIQSRKSGGAIYPIVAKVPAQVPHKYGTNYLAYFNRFIPRRLWPDKPRGIGIECAEVFYGRRNTGGIPPGGLGEAYWSGGFFGIAIVFFTWGAVLKTSGNFFVRFRSSAFASLLYLVTLTRLGPSEPQFRAWLYTIVPAIALLALFGVVRRSGRRR